MNEPPAADTLSRDSDSTSPATSPRPSANLRRAERTSKARTLLLIVIVGLGVAAFGKAIGSGLGQMSGISDPVADPIPDEPRLAPTEAAPDFGKSPTDEERIAHWLRLLTMGDQDDIAWAKRQILRGGAPARLAVIQAAERSLRSNSGFVQHVFDILITQPGPDALGLARSALNHRDPHLALRASHLLAGIGNDDARAAAGLLALIARNREGQVSRAALEAMAHLGGADVMAALRQVLDDLEPAQQGIGYLALAAAGAKSAIPYLQRKFAEASEPEGPDADADETYRKGRWHRLQIAEALVRLGDDTANAWLIESVDDSGDAAFRDAALGVLSHAAHPAALAAIRRSLRGLIGEERQEALVGLLGRFTLTPEVEQLLSELVGPDHPEPVRVAAYEVLVLGDAEGAMNELLAMLKHAGDGGTANRQVAALVLGRVRRPDSVDALTAAAEHLSANGDLQAQLLIRALALVGTPEAAETIVRAMAADTSDYTAGGVSFGVWRALGDHSPEFESAFSALVVRALDGEFGEPRKSGLQYLLFAAGSFCGKEVTAHAARALKHADAPVRQAAARALGEVGGDGAEAALRAAWRRPEEMSTRSVIRTALEHLHYRAPRSR